MVEACIPSGASNICYYQTENKKKAAAGMAALPGAVSELVSSLDQMRGEKPDQKPVNVPVGETPPTTESIA